MTLENQGIGAFPDAPTLRGQKHVRELADAQRAGYHSYVLFIVQFEKIQMATIHTAMQPSLLEEIKQAEAVGVQVLAYNCRVTPAEVAVEKAVPFDPDFPFVDPNV